VVALSTEWSRSIPDGEWEIYQKVIDDARQSGIPFALGGAFAVAAYTGLWRNTKDLDLYVTPQNRDRMIQVLSRYGFSDYFETHSYDRWWIYRGFKEGMIVDIIWAAANHRTQVQDSWISGPEVEVRARRVRVLPVEVILQDKLYIMQRERCDWPDVLNLLFSWGGAVDWERLLRELKDDAPLLAGALSVFRWIAPGHARELPPWLWQRTGLAPLPPGPAVDFIQQRADLLDRRPWFGPDRERKKPAA
jgi:hypothetical protein